MLTKAKFKIRFNTYMEKKMGWCESKHYDAIANGCYEMYEEDPDDMTPEEHADEEMDEWARN